jgi:hypothetical protein
VYETNSVSMVKLDNFPVFSTKKTEKNKFCRKKSQNSQKSYLAFKLIFFPLKCHHIDWNWYLGRNFFAKIIMSGCLQLLKPLCPATSKAGARWPKRGLVATTSSRWLDPKQELRPGWNSDFFLEECWDVARIYFVMFRGGKLLKYDAQGSLSITLKITLKFK